MVKLKRISRGIFRAGDLSVSCVVMLNTSTEKYANFTKQITMNGKIEEYSLATSMLPLLTFNIYDKDDRAYNRSKSLVIQPRYIPQLIIGLHKVIKQFDRDDIFYTKDKKTALYAFKEDMAVSINNIGDNHVLAAPALIDDTLNDGAIYEAYQFYFNKTTYHVALTYDEIVSLHYTLSHMDIFTLSQSMVNTLILSTMTNTLAVKDSTYYHDEQHQAFSDAPIATSTGISKKNSPFDL